MPQPFKSFMPVLKLLTRRRKDETEAQWRRRFDRMQEAYNKVLAMRTRLNATIKEK